MYKIVKILHLILFYCIIFFGDYMYEFVNRADIEIKFVFYKMLAEKTYHCDFRPANSLVFYIKGGHRFYYSDKQIESRCGDIVLLPYGTNYSNETLSDDTQYYQIDFAIYDMRLAKEY